MNTPNCGDCFNYRPETGHRNAADQDRFAKCAVANPMVSYVSTQRDKPIRQCVNVTCGAEGVLFEAILELSDIRIPCNNCGRKFTPSEKGILHCSGNCHANDHCTYD